MMEPNEHRSGAFSARLKVLCAIAGGVGLWVSTACAEESIQMLQSSDKTFELAGDILHAKDVSAIARGDRRFGVLASDEGAVIQIVEFSSSGRGALVLGNYAVDPLDAEIDFEAATFMDGWFYVSGSHGAAKKSGEFNEPRSRLYRFRLNEDGQVMQPVEMVSLQAVFDADPLLAPFHRKPLQQRGLNIEGLSSRGGQLYFGLRSPNVNGDAVVLRVHAEQLFGDVPPPDYELLMVPLGEGLGIRAMTAVRNGFLLIAGNAGSESSKAQPTTMDYDEGRPSELFHWNPEQGRVTFLGQFPRVGKGKEEAILRLSALDAGEVEIVVLYDNRKGGDPHCFVVPLPD